MERNGRRARTTRATCSETSPTKRRPRCRRAHGVFLATLWIFVVLENDGVAVLRSVAAEGPMLPPSSSLLSLSPSSVSKPKARIVIPSPCRQDDEEDAIDSYNEPETPQELLSSTFAAGRIGNPTAFPLGKEPRFAYRSPLRSTPPVRTHRSTSNAGGDGDCEGVGEGFSCLEPPIVERVESPSSSSPMPPPPRSSFKKTGTTIAGCVVLGDRSGPCVVLAADTRATAGTIVADKRCDKIHKLASNCRCCGAGTSADLDKVTRQVLYQMALRELHNTNIGNGKSGGDGNGADNGTKRTELLYQNYGNGDGDGGDDGLEALLWMRPVSIEVVCGIFQDTLFRSGGQLGANLIVGGVWKNEAFLRAIHPHGSADVDLPFAALGSGGMAAIAVLEDGYRSSLTLHEGIDLVRRAIRSGIRNDLGSGSRVDLCVIDSDGVCHQTRGFVPEEELLPDGDDCSTANSSSSSDASSGNGLLELLLGSGRGDDDERRNNEEGTNNDANNNVGVNGFGNQPFAVETTKQRVVSVEMVRAKQKETWDRVLGL